MIRELPFRRHPTALAVLLVLAYVVFAVTATVNESATHDEIAHVVAGQSYWQFADFRLQSENGNLSQRWEALPAWLLGAHFPAATDPAWLNSDVWTLGHAHFYELGNNTDWLLFLARAMNCIWAAATALLIFVWTRRLFGCAGAFTALAFCLLCPNMLANGPLATSDMAATFFLVAASGAFWYQLEHPVLRSTLLSAVIFGLACLAKFSAVLLLPVLAGLVVVRGFGSSPLVAGRRTFTTCWGKWLAGTGSLLVHAVIAWGMIWLAYDFSFVAANPGLPPQTAYYLSWEKVISKLSASETDIISMVRGLHLLPDAFLHGFATCVAFARTRGAFFNGETANHGWAWFFPYTFAVKTTLPFLLALVGATAAALFRWSKRGAAQLRTDLYRTAPLGLFFAVYLAASLTSQLNIGFRHLLPLLPALFIFTGLLGGILWRASLPGRLVLAGLVIWSAAEATVICPHYLAYFNPLAGGPAQGYRHLVDSSLDWGQDLPGLAQWLNDRWAAGDQRPAYLSYFGVGDEDYEGIRAVRLPRLPALHVPGLYRMGPGIYCISATMLQQPYGLMPGPWTLKYEQEFQLLRAYETVAPPAPRQDPARLPPDAAWQVYDWLRFTRLCHYLRSREPDAQVGYSILIYNLSASELRAAVGGPVSELTRAINQALQSHH